MSKGAVMPESPIKPSSPTWTFAKRFRRGAFGWKSDVALRRLGEAEAEILAVQRHDPALAAEGAVRLLEKISPAFENVDDSSGRLQAELRGVFEDFARLIGSAEVPRRTRDRWLERLWQAILDDEMPWIEGLGDHWGALCGSPDVASAWADRFLPELRASWSSRAKGDAWFPGTDACLSSLYAAGRHAELLALLKSPHTHHWWDYLRWGVKALLDQGQREAALAMAERAYASGHHRHTIAEACESILLDLGDRDRAYRQYAMEAHQRHTNLATLKSLAARYPEKDKATLVADLVEAHPGSEGKWFAAAKSAGLYDVALRLAASSPTDPKTLARAARDFAQKQPGFALEAGLLSLGWIAKGYGYEIDTLDVAMAWRACQAAAAAAGVSDDALRQRVEALCAGPTKAERFVRAGVGLTLAAR